MEARAHPIIMSAETTEQMAIESLLEGETLTPCSLSFEKLSNEVVTMIILYLETKSILSLRGTCRYFQDFLEDDSFCKYYLKVKAPFSQEFMDAPKLGYARALRILTKTQEAIISASPYVAAVVGHGECFYYNDGTLCYVREKRLHILDLQYFTNHEIVVDIPVLISQAFPNVFKILHHAEDITSCFYSSDLQKWLLIINAREHRLNKAIPLTSTNKLFVRNTKDHLIFGHYSRTVDDPRKRWILRHYDLQQNKLSRSKIHLHGIVRDDIGKTVCFEIFGQHLYGCANQTASEIDDMNLTSSYYYCFRVFLVEFRPKKMQVMSQKHSWRREQMEGPIDDFWYFLKLYRDVGNGVIKIVECRAEWLKGLSGKTRSYYTKDVEFHHLERVHTFVDEISESRDDLVIRSEEAAAMAKRKRNVSTFHRGDTRSLNPQRKQVHLSTYFPGSGTYLDFLEDRADSDSGPRQLRIRTGTKLYGDSERAYKSQVNPLACSADVSNIDEAMQPNIIYNWPLQPEKNRDPFLGPLNGMLERFGSVGTISAMNDDRSIVYGIDDGSNGLQSFIYLSFDPSVRLAGAIRPNRHHLKDFEALRLTGGKDIFDIKREAEPEQETFSGSLSDLADPLAPRVEASARQDLLICKLPDSVNGRSWAEIQIAHHLGISEKFSLAW